VAGDENLRKAFIAGEDIHSATAERMFGVNMTSLSESEPKLFGEYRDKAKRINFGIVYGQRGGGLARSLSQAGVETNDDEGRVLLEQYLSAYPQIASWVNHRDDFVDQFTRSHGEVDWSLTLLLHRTWPLVRRAVREHRDEHRNWPGAEEVLARLGSPWTIEEVAWSLSFEASVVIDTNGEVFGFDSLTESGRRQQFTFHTEGVLEQAAKTVIGSNKDGSRLVREQISDRHNLELRNAGQSLSSAEITKILEDRKIRRAVIEQVEQTMGQEARTLLLNRSLESRISQMANAYRNAPIQGGVADIMLEAYGLLHSRLDQFDRAFGVQTVHDSVVVECNKKDARTVASTVKNTLEEAMQIWCPDIPAVADTDIRGSLSDNDVIETV